MKITIAKALNYKNRMAAKLRDVSNSIHRNNSVIEGATRQINVAEAITLRADIQNALIQLKMGIYESNMAVQEKIFTAAELRGEIGVWAGMDTTEGKHQHSPRFGGEMITEVKTVIVNYEQVEIRKKTIQADLDRIQDALDEHNHKTKIEVPDNIADLV